jgi:hypothetical protein
VHNSYISFISEYLATFLKRDTLTTTTRKLSPRPMTDQRKTRKSQDGNTSMMEVKAGLPSATSSVSSSSAYKSTTPQLLYQSSPPSFTSGLYQLPYSGAQSPPIYGSPTPVETAPYYPYSPARQQLDPSQTGYHYGVQVGYGNSPIASATLPQFVAGAPGTAQQGPTQPYNLPRYQPYPQSPDRSMSIPSYMGATPPHGNQQFIQQPSLYSVFPQSFPSTVASPTLSDEPSSLIPADLEIPFPRGPPRKPKQSGFAIWVGNLPRDVFLEELKEFFALKGLESIFLIRRSNCAFVNYKTEEACSLALSTFHDKCTMDLDTLTNR